VDWAHFGEVSVGRARRRLSCFLITLSYSRALYLEFFFDQSMENFRVAMSTRFKLGRVNHEFFSTIISAVPCWNEAATRFTFILDCWSCARIITLLLVPARYGQEIKKDEWSEQFFMYASHSGPAEHSPLWKS
jgi:hypothetical protein